MPLLTRRLLINILSERLPSRMTVLSVPPKFLPCRLLVSSVSSMPTRWPTAHADHPFRAATQQSPSVEHPTHDSAPPTACIEHAKQAHPPTAHMENCVQHDTQLSINSARMGCPTIAELALPTLLMKLLPRKPNDFLSFPTPPDPADPTHHDFAALFLTALHPFR
jgi:hypothetical protein